MKINANQALSTYRNYKKYTSDIEKSLERISSGIKLNTAGDNAAAMAQNSKIKAQLGGLNKAEQNLQDGQNLVQTADSGIGNIQNVLQRMRELAVQAANGTNTDEDRAVIQREIDQLKGTVDDIATGTEFNHQKLLVPKTEMNTQTVENRQIDIVFFIDDSGSMAEEISMVAKGIEEFAKKITVYGNVNIGTQSITKESNKTALTNQLDNLGSKVIDTYISKDSIINGRPIPSGYGVTYHYQTMDNYMNNPSALGGRPGAETIFVVLTDTADESRPSETFKQQVKKKLEENNIQTYVFGFDFADESPETKNRFPEKEKEELKEITDNVFFPETAGEVADTITPGLTNQIIKNSNWETTEKNEIYIQSGINASESTRIPLYDHRAEALGISHLDLTTQEGAEAALAKIDAAIETESTRRAQYGAISNRLERTQEIVGGAITNFTKISSNLGNTDIAEEMMRLTSSRITMQSSQSMMAQINQHIQGVLTLLQN